MRKPLELVCPAGTPAALYAAVDAGADAVYAGFRDETNARNFPGLNFSREELAEGIAYAHEHNRKIFLAINTYARAGKEAMWRTAVDDAVQLGVDAVILADIGLLAYASENHSELRLHLSVQASASNPETIRFFQKEFGIKRVVLPRVLTTRDIKQLNAEVEVETEVFAFGGMCPMAEGRCSLSSYVTGQSPNQHGVCSPAAFVRYEQGQNVLVTKLGNFTINRFADHEQAGYPTLCKGRFVANQNAEYLFEEPTSLNALMMLPELYDAGVAALKIEGRQRGKAYVRDVVSHFRKALDAFARGERIVTDMAGLCEGQQNTTGAYRKQWQ